MEKLENATYQSASPSLEDGGVIAQTRQALRLRYQGELDELSCLLEPEVVWIEPYPEHTACGRDAALDLLRRESAFRWSLRDEQYQLVLQQAQICLLTADYILEGSDAFGFPLTIRCRATICWHQSGRWRIRHMHLSSDARIFGKDTCIPRSLSGPEAAYLRDIESMAFCDCLTQLWNKNTFLRDLEQFTPSPLRLNVCACVDCDNLKEINDTYGHSMGDQVLTCMGALLLRVFGEHGKCYRCGGDEFCALFTCRDQAELDALRTRLDDEQHRCVVAGSVVLRFSAGYAVYDPVRDAGIRAAVDRADRSMYEKKRRRLPVE